MDVEDEAMSDGRRLSREERPTGSSMKRGLIAGRGLWGLAFSEREDDRGRGSARKGDGRYALCMLGRGDRCGGGGGVWDGVVVSTGGREGRMVARVKREMVEVGGRGR